MYGVKLRAHIVPVGYEFDRIVLPIVKMNADKVWLLSNNELVDSAKSCKKKVIAELDVLGVKHDFEECNITDDLYDTLRVMRKIIKKEKDNDVFINVSSGSKIAAIAGMMASMMFKSGTRITPYYVKPEGYGSKDEKHKAEIKPQSYGLKDIQILPDYKIEHPEEHLISFLKIINARDSRGEKTSKKNLIKDAKEKKLISVGGEDKNKKQSEYMSLNKNYIEPLLSWGLIKIEKTGKHRKILLTEDGLNMLKFLA